MFVTSIYRRCGSADPANGHNNNILIQKYYDIIDKCILIFQTPFEWFSIIILLLLRFVIGQLTVCKYHCCDRNKSKSDIIIKN